MLIMAKGLNLLIKSNLSLTMNLKSVYFLLMPDTSSKNKKTVAKKEKEPSVMPKKATEKKASSTNSKEKVRTMSKTNGKTAVPAANSKDKGEKKPAGKAPFKKEVTQKLMDAKSRILHEVTSKVRTESDSHKFEIGDIYDIASSERERELALMLGDRDREKLAEIEEALERIRNNTYGGCEECGEPIAEDRLRALPFTRVCVECQSRNEREQKIKGRFEEESGLGIMERPDMEEEEY